VLIPFYEPLEILKYACVRLNAPACTVLRTVELNHYEQEYNEQTGGEQTLSLKFAKICIQIFHAKNEQPS